MAKNPFRPQIPMGAGHGFSKNDRCVTYSRGPSGAGFRSTWLKSMTKSMAKHALRPQIPMGAGQLGIVISMAALLRRANPRLQQE